MKKKQSTYRIVLKDKQVIFINTDEFIKMLIDNELIYLKEYEMWLSVDYIAKAEKIE